MSLPVGSLCVLSPFPLEYNPVRHCPARIGLFLGTSWHQERRHSVRACWRVLTEHGLEELHTNRWSIERVPEVAE